MSTPYTDLTKMIFVFQSTDGGHKLHILSTDYHSAYKQTLNLPGSWRCVDLIATEDMVLL